MACQAYGSSSKKIGSVFSKRSLPFICFRQIKNRPLKFIWSVIMVCWHKLPRVTDKICLFNHIPTLFLSKFWLILINMSTYNYYLFTISRQNNVLLLVLFRMRQDGSDIFLISSNFFLMLNFIMQNIFRYPVCLKVFAETHFAYFLVSGNGTFFGCHILL